MRTAPKIEGCPGLRWAARADGSFVAYWIARDDLVKRGYPTKTARLWKGTEPTATEKLVIADECTRLQSQMLAWSRNAGSTVAPFDCTMTALIKLYQCDEGGYWSSRTQPNQLCH